MNDGGDKVRMVEDRQLLGGMEMTNESAEIMDSNEVAGRAEETVKWAKMKQFAREQEAYLEAKALREGVRMGTSSRQRAEVRAKEKEYLKEREAEANRLEVLRAEEERIEKALAALSEL